ncbi:hypothetical protein CK203_086923 [Vitis vinifera]|uniref:Uncharacterized protein n=1 Tax=Vitis vinifera TaxID=29760 RepID=A0A438EAR9_VITVI|nr:hypothetical protein CK203_086923 [Vitis vinifera]
MLGPISQVHSTLNITQDNNLTEFKGWTPIGRKKRRPFGATITVNLGTPKTFIGSCIVYFNMAINLNLVMLKPQLPNAKALASRGAEWRLRDNLCRGVGCKRHVAKDTAWHGVVRERILRGGKNHGGGALRSRAIFALEELLGKFTVYLLFHLHYHCSSSSSLAVWGFVCLFGDG